MFKKNCRTILNLLNIRWIFIAVEFHIDIQNAIEMTKKYSELIAQIKIRNKPRFLHMEFCRKNWSAKKKPQTF